MTTGRSSSKSSATRPRSPEVPPDTSRDRKPPTSVLLIHRYQVLVEVLANALAQQSDIEWAGSAASLPDALDLLQSQKFDIVLFESPSVPEGVDLVRQLNREFPQSRAVPLGLRSSQDIAQLLEAGACGYVPLNATLDEFLSTVRLVSQNQAPCSSAVVQTVLQRLRELSQESVPVLDERPSSSGPQLTDKEHQVIRRLARGLSNRAVADELKVSISTVKMHVHHILGKLEVRNRREAVRAALERGIL